MSSSLGPRRFAPERNVVKSKSPGVNQKQVFRLSLHFMPCEKKEIDTLVKASSLSFLIKQKVSTCMTGKHLRFDFGFVLFC